MTGIDLIVAVGMNFADKTAVDMNFVEVPGSIVIITIELVA